MPSGAALEPLVHARPGDERTFPAHRLRPLCQPVYWSGEVIAGRAGKVPRGCVCLHYSAMDYMLAEWTKNIPLINFISYF